MPDYLEDETCRRFVLPALQRAGWDLDDQVLPQYPIAAGPIRAGTRHPWRDDGLIADYALEYRPGVVIGVVEAKRTRRHAGDGIEQARLYASRLDVPFAYATNGLEINEIDLDAGPIRKVLEFPGPHELWRRYCRAHGIKDGLPSELTLEPFNLDLLDREHKTMRPRYYQALAVNRTVQAIGRGQKRILLVLATGTGKTFVAFQIVAKLWRSSWTPGRRPRVLYLADRNILIDQPKDEYFARVFGDAVHKLGQGVAKRSRHIYFALYQSMERGDEEALFKQFEDDFFDLVIVDECHRGSARAESQWRRILEYYSKATQLGMTATPISTRDADTYRYFGEPIYEYSLAQGIQDGFLAPYRVRKVRLNVDITGWRPAPGQQDIYGNEIPDDLYTPTDYERVLAILERTEEAAQYITDYLRQSGNMGKTIVFCENNDHADRMRTALNNQNTDIRAYDPFVCRITDADGPYGRIRLDEFRDVESDAPVIAVTSKLLTTGIDMPTVRNIVLFRRIGSLPEFKQIVGRGTRIFEPAGKLAFDIIDFVEATRLFNDPAFDGPPMRVVRDETDESGHFVGSEVEAEFEQADDEQVAERQADYREEAGGRVTPPGEITDAEQMAEIRSRSRRLYVDGVEVYVWGQARYIPEGDKLKLVEVRQYVRDRVLAMDMSPTDLRAQWARARSRSVLLAALKERDISYEELAESLGQQEVDPIDLLIHVAWDTALITRQERARRVRREHREFLESFRPEARRVLDQVLEKYADYGPEHLSSEVLDVPPFNAEMPSRVVELFGGPDKFREALDQLGAYLYDVA